MLGLRKTAAVAGLLTLAGLITTLDLTTPTGSVDRFGVSMWLMLGPLGFASLGILREAPWGRWLALGAAVAVFPWALILTVAPLGLPMFPQSVALAASALILVSLTGRSVFENFDGRSETVDWAPREMKLVRWTIVCGIAALPALFLFIGAYEFQRGWHVAVPTALFIGLLLGVVLLARGKTIGILAVAASGIAMVPAARLYASWQAVDAGAAILLAPAFLPALGAGFASLLVFGAPMWRLLRGE